MAGKRVLVTGGGTFLGDNIAAALLNEGADVTVLVRPGAEDKLGALANRARWWTADVWDSASLKGRARGQAVVVHTVGSLVADPAHGLTHQWLNFVSARNVANMCVSGGVGLMVLMSSARAPWINGAYLAAKREAEDYLERVGLRAIIIRAPLTYVRGARRPLVNRLLTLFGNLPPFAWLGLRRVAPMPIDVLARGVARIALEGRPGIYSARDLRRRNTRAELRGALTVHLDPRRPTRPLEQMGEDAPFGWTPDEGRRP